MNYYSDPINTEKLRAEERPPRVRVIFDEREPKDHLRLLYLPGGQRRHSPGSGNSSGKESRRPVDTADRLPTTSFSFL